MTLKKDRLSERIFHPGGKGAGLHLIYQENYIDFERQACKRMIINKDFDNLFLS
jgi:hypothetical protein